MVIPKGDHVATWQLGQANSAGAARAPGAAVRVRAVSENGMVSEEWAFVAGPQNLALRG